MDSLLTTEQVAGILNCKIKTVYSWAENGKIPSFKINGLVRFVPAEIMEWIKNFRPESEAEFQIKKYPQGDVNIDNIIKKAIAEAKKKRYNSSIKGKPDLKPERRFDESV